ncbi:MAG: hypothetical protein P4L53_07945 [Candidatus Obscuribacterales bacterium]|nr:hypothetical protein [Candidatus Obscuribacterales bacterium]
MKHLENNEGMNADKNVTANVARETLAQFALTLYQCPDGSLVRHPSECKEPMIGTPYLELTNIFKS